MRIISILEKGINAMITEASTPESFRIGQKFEDYVQEYLFPKNYYDLIDKTHDFNTNNKNYVESSLKPDFKYRDKWTKKEFFVEAKFRTGFYNGKIEWCNTKQLSRYQQYNKETPTFLIIGMGDNPSYPEALALIPLSQAKYTGLFVSLVEKFEVEPDKPIPSKVLWNR